MSNEVGDSAVWLPGAGQTAKHLLWVPKLSPSQCAVTPIYEEMLDAVRICCDGICRDLLE